MGAFSGQARGFAAVVALCAWVGLAFQFQASTLLAGSPGGAAWAMVRYFTVITNLLLGVVFSGVALGRPGFGAPSLLGGVTLSILLVGGIYGLLLRDLIALSGGAKLADLLLHHATPIVAPLFWLGYAPKGGLRRLDPLMWAIFPLAYFVYALVRGGVEGVYAYPFMDLGKLGWGRTIVNASMIAAGFVCVGYVVVWLDGRLGRTQAAR